MKIVNKISSEMVTDLEREVKLKIVACKYRKGRHENILKRIMKRYLGYPYSVYHWRSYNAYEDFPDYKLSQIYKELSKLAHEART